MRLIKAGLVVLILSLNLATPVVAGPREDALAAYNRGDYPTAFRLISRLAEQGDPAVEAALGVMYNSGLGVPQNYAEAAKWFHRAAERGSGSACSMLGIIYTNGYGVSRDDNAAMKWFLQAANRGDAGGTGFLGIMYEYGRGVSIDYVQAYKWYSLAVAVPLPVSEIKMHTGFIEDRDSVAAKMTPGQIAEAKKLASEWKPNSQ